MKLLIALSLLMASYTVYATERYVINNTYNTYNAYTESQSLGMSMSAIDFDANTKSLQVGIGGALYQDQYGNKASSIAVGAGMRVCEDSTQCGLLKITGGVNEGGGKGAAVGIVWKL